jgi:hypothetical protein
MHGMPVYVNPKKRKLDPTIAEEMKQMREKRR